MNEPGPVAALDTALTAWTELLEPYTPILAHAAHPEPRLDGTPVRTRLLRYLGRPA